MNKSSTYRTVAGLVAAVFLVFNVGLTIVVASCPMTDTRTFACGMCSEQASAEKVTSTKNASCCMTIVAADKNSTEFIQSKASTWEQSNAIVASLVVFDLRDFSQRILSSFQVPPLFTDIPIFTSSLLI